MSTPVSWNGITFNVPGTGDQSWSGSSGVDGLLISLAQNGFQKTGGLFTLSADVDFGNLSGIKALYFKSRSANIAATGVFRLANSETLVFRNAANSGDLALGVNGSDQLTFNGVAFSNQVNAIGALDGQAANATGLTIASNTLYAQSADATHPGMVNNTTQALSGAKTLSGALTLSTAGDSLTLVGGGAAAGIIKFKNVPASGHYNWLTGAQYNADATFEITPSTVADGNTFSTPVFKVAQTGAGSVTGVFTASGFYSSATPQPSSGTVRLANGDSIAFRDSTNAANYIIGMEGATGERFTFNNSFLIARSVAGLLRTVQTNSSSSASAINKFTLSTNAGDFNFSADSLASSGTAIIQVDATFVGGMLISTNGGGNLTLGTTVNGFVMDKTTGALKFAAYGSGILHSDGSGNITSQGFTQNINGSAKTGNYTAASIDDVLRGDSSGGTFQFTLPTAVGISGKTYVFKKIDSSSTVITIGTTSSQTIDGVTSTTLNTQYEQIEVISNGTNWDVLDRQYPQDWTTYTPTWAGLGTVSNNNAAFRRVGDSVEVAGGVTAGTATGVNVTMTLPNSLSLASSAKIPATFICGGGGFGANGAIQLCVLAIASASTISFGIQGASNAGITPVFGSLVPGSAASMYYKFTVPFSTWKSWV